MRILRSKSIGFILLIIIVILTIGCTKWFVNNKKNAQNPNYCITCHEMQPAFYTWKVSTHNKLNCTVCHDISLTSLRYSHNNGYPQPIKLKKDIENTICLQCHDKNKAITPPGDLIVPHQLHMQKGLDCIDCHSNIAHGNSVDKLIVPQLISPKDFGTEEAKLLSKNNNNVPMSKCLECHNGKMAPKNCAACHKVERLPQFHQGTDWGYNHGSAALDNINSCNKCHGEDLALTPNLKKKNNGKISATNFARYNLFCQNCHKERPVTHTTFFAIDHAKTAKSSRQGCYVCHDTKLTTNFGKLGQPSNNTYCNKCHVTKHPQEWLKTHKSQVIKYGKAKCLTCHDAATSCNSCHQKYK